MGQGMKSKVVQMALTVVEDIFSEMNSGGVLDDAHLGISTMTDNTLSSANINILDENIGIHDKLIVNEIPFHENENTKNIKNEIETKKNSMLEYKKMNNLKLNVLDNILGIKDQFNNRPNYLDFAVILKSQKMISKDVIKPHNKSVVITNLCDWKNDYYDSKLPVKCSWPLDCLGSFSGENFERWLVLLANESKPSLEEMIVGFMAENGRGLKAASLLSASSAVSNIYKLLKLACPDEGHRWVILAQVIATDTGKEETEVEGREDTDEFEELMVIDASAAAVQAYCSLMEVCSLHVIYEIDETQNIRRTEGNNEGSGFYVSDKDSSDPCKVSHIEQLISAAQGAVTSANGLLRRGGGLGSGGTEESIFGFGTRAELGIMELCGKLLEGVTSQHISSGTPTIIAIFFYNNFFL